MRNIVDADIAGRLRLARESAGLSASGLSKLARITGSHVGLIEAGERVNPQLKTLAAIASVLGVSLDWLVYGEGEMPAPDDVRASVEAARAFNLAPTGTEGA